MSNEGFIQEVLQESSLSRRSFLKLSAVMGGAATAQAGLGYGLKAVAADGHKKAALNGEWVTAPCWHNCSCGNSRCLIQAYVVDGVPVRIRSDEEDEDLYDFPQRRACPRGRAQIDHVLAADRIKYPMIRKHWEPGGGNKELRGKDEWVRISWDEALDIAAREINRIYDTHGPKSIFTASWGYENGEILWDPVLRVFNALGGHVSHYGTVSFGAWPFPEAFMTGSMLDCNDRFAMRHAKLLVLIGCNWASNKGGNTAYFVQQAKDSGAKVIVVDPWLNRTAKGLADQWIPIRPGTDTAFLLGAAYHMIVNDLQDQDFLDTYCSGFDADHMPEGASKEDNFKDYVLGTYDGQPKTPEWASQICGVQASVIRDFAVQVSSIKPTSFYAGQSTTKFPAGEQFAQVFFTFGWMTGNVGRPGANVSWIGPDPNFTVPLVTAGRYGDTIPPNPIYPDKIIFCIDLNTKREWECLEYSEAWQSIVDGEYGRDSWPGGKRPIDIRMIYHGHAHFLNSLPNAQAGIEAHRKVDFVMASCLHYNTNAHYADLVLPISTLWERHGQVMGDNREHVLWWQNVIQPLFEAREDIDVAYGLADRLGLDADAIYGNPWPQKEFNTLAGAMVMKPDGSGMEPLVTITAQDIEAMGVEGQPQKGRITVEEFRQKGIYKVPREMDDALMHVAHAPFIEDPEANPVATSTGKFEIYCPTLAMMVNQYGFSEIAPIGKYQEAEPDHGYAARTEDYPLVLFTPHSLRRAHTNLDNVPSLREAFPQGCFMSVVDADARGIKTDDVVLMTSPHGKVLRRAKVMHGMVPGAVALEDGAWTDIDEETGIDLGGNPNILQAPKASGQGVQCWTGTLLQVEKYNGELLADADRPAHGRKIRFAKDSA